MKKIIITLAAVAASFFGQAQQEPIPVIEDRTTPIIKPLKLSGFRVGLTAMDGNSIDPSRFTNKEDFRMPNVISQFGWHMEYLYMTTPDGYAGVLEVIPLIGGWENNLILPSLNIVMGIRSPEGFELGAGPSYSVAGAGFIAAIGYTFKMGHLNIPINFAYTFSGENSRFTTLAGFNSRSQHHGNY